MRRLNLVHRKRAELFWMLAGFLAIQIGLAVDIERFSPAIRDPEFSALLGRLHALQARAPDRPLILALGSSRTQMGLRAQQLSQNPDSQAAPLIFNFSIAGSGPMMQRIVLERLLAEGVRPAAVFMELMPMSLSRRGGAPIEERMLDSARLTGPEVQRLCRYYNQPYKLLSPWCIGRLLPVRRHGAEFQEALGLDGSDAGQPAWASHSGADSYGWHCHPGYQDPNELKARLEFALGQYEAAFQDALPADGPVNALRDLLALCQSRRLHTVLMLPPEGTQFRAAYASADPQIMQKIRETAAMFAVPVIDARDWVSDDGFWDGHHMCVKGADQYTERFEREALRPMLEWLARGSTPARDEVRALARSHQR
jgi:uncharacterized protein DUF1574